MRFRLSLVEENQLNSVLGSDDSRVAHVMDRRARARPFAASKLAVVVVAIVALGTADAATLSGSAGAGYQYTTTGTDTSGEEALYGHLRLRLEHLRRERLHRQHR